MHSGHAATKTNKNNSTADELSPQVAKNSVFRLGQNFGETSWHLFYRGLNLKLFTLVISDSNFVNCDVRPRGDANNNLLDTMVIHIFEMLIVHQKFRLGHFIILYLFQAIQSS